MQQWYYLHGLHERADGFKFSLKMGAITRQVLICLVICFFIADLHGSDLLKLRKFCKHDLLETFRVYVFAVLDVTKNTATSIPIGNAHVEEIFLKPSCFFVLNFRLLLSTFIRATM